MSWYVAAYDMDHPGRRLQVAKVLSQYGHRVQRSVFEVWIETQELREVRRRVGSLLSAEDSFDLFPIDVREPGKRIRWQESPDVHDAVTLL